MSGNIKRLRDYVQAMTGLVADHGDDEAEMLDRGRVLLGELVAHDDWLPDAFAEPHPEHYQQYLLYCDPLERFSVVSFVWGPGQGTPVHDHTVWGLIGMLRGRERCEEFAEDDNGVLAKGASHLIKPGEIDAVSPRIGDVHRVSNALSDEPSISIHIYGANIGAVRRHVFDAETGAPTDFISGYSSASMPNLWDRSHEG